MELAMLAEYIKPELVIILALCYALGMFLKASPAIKDWTIPWFVLAFGIVMTILYIAIMLDQGFVPKAILEGFVQGFIIAAVAVFVNQLKKQTTERG